MKFAKTRAFTIMEVTVAMLLTGLTLGITYTVYAIVTNSYSNFNLKNQKIEEAINADHVLKRDFERADTVLKDAAGVTMVFDNEIVKYSFYPEFLTRESNKIDTFKVKTMNCTTLFENTPLEETGTDRESNRVDELRFILMFGTDSIREDYHKTYSSENLIQRNRDAVN